MKPSAAADKSPHCVNARRDSPPSQDPAVGAPLLSLPLALPPDLAQVLWTYLVPASPFLPRIDGPGFRFPVVRAMRDLESLGLACKALQRIASSLRRSPDFADFRAQASRMEFERHLFTDAARQGCIVRWDVDPEAGAAAASRSMQARLFRPSDVQALCANLQASGAQVQELKLFVHSPCLGGLHPLVEVLPACSALTALKLSTDASLPGSLIRQLAMLPALRSLHLKAPALAPGCLAELGSTALAGQLQTLHLSISTLTAEDLTALATAFAARAQCAAPPPQVRHLSVAGARLDQATCAALCTALKYLPRLEWLHVEGKQAGLCTAAAKALVETAASLGKPRRLGLHNLDAPGKAGAVFQALQGFPALQELAFSGRLDETLATGPWTLLAQSTALCSLDLRHCELGAQAMSSLVDAIARSTSLRELSLTGMKLTLKRALSLAEAMGRNRALLRLTLRDCAIEGPYACAVLGKAIAAHPSLLVFQFLLERLAGARTAPLTRDMADAARTSNSLLQFDLSARASDGAGRAQPQLEKNRLR